jgi:hypothetical protein
MSEVGPRKTCGVSGRVYREFRGEKYWWWEKRKLYANQKGGKQRLLHREAFGAGGEERIAPLNGDWDDFSPDNWGPSSITRKRPNVKHECQVFNGVRFYRTPDRGYFARRTPNIVYMHRVVYEAVNGPIPDGWHVHHINGDKGDNRPENLAAMPAFNHLSLHANSSKWVGSEANKQQLREAAVKAKDWHKSEEGLAWHAEHGRRTWEGRKPVAAVCTVCGADYETFYPKTSRFCGKRCKGKAFQERKRAGL